MDSRIIVFLGTPLLFLVLQCVARQIKARRWSCSMLGWHDGDGVRPHFKSGDVFGVNLTSKCSKCGKDVIQDSQGNWF